MLLYCLAPASLPEAWGPSVPRASQVVLCGTATLGCAPQVATQTFPAAQLAFLFSVNSASSVRSVLILSFFFSVALSAGCGGGPAQPQTLQPPAPQDFSITLSTNSLSLPQGGTSPPVNVSVIGQNGFTGAVQVTLSGLPSAVQSNPPSPFSVAAGANTSVVFGAAPNAGTGSFTITAQAASGALSHSATFALIVQGSAASSLPRTTYVRTDATAAMDDPPGEPRHRRSVYDPATKHLFLANRAMNRVEVFSTTDQPPVEIGERVAQITVPGASSADLSPDGATLWVGTVTQQAVAIDTASLRVASRYTIQSLSPVPNSSFDRPEEILALANGNCLMRLRQSSGVQALPALWNPATNSLTNLSSAVPHGLGAMARTADHAKVIVAANDSSGVLTIFDSNGAVLLGPHTLGNGAIPLVAASPDGSRFAVAFVANGASQLLLLSGSLNQLGAPVPVNARSLTFSRDGKFLYASQNSGVPAISVFDGQSLQQLGQVPDASIQGVPSEIEDADETQLLFGIANRGVSFIDACGTATPGCASQSGTLPSSVPSFAAAPVAQPSEGPAVGGTSTSLAGQNFEPTAQVKFGAQLAGSATVAGTTQIQASSPPSVASGGVNLTAYFPSGWLALTPDAFSYGPQLLDILPNAGTPSGGDTVQIYGYGFGSDASKITISIGGSNAAIQKVENVTSIGPSLGLDTTYPFSLQRITLQTPAGSPGKADLVLTAPSGTVTAPKTFQYLQSVQLYPYPKFPRQADLYKFLLYDQKRHLVYLSGTDHVGVFDLERAVFEPGLTLWCPNQNSPGPCPNAGLRGMALTPDDSQLVVADFGSQNVYLLNPDAPGAVTLVHVAGVPGFAASGPARVAATSTQTVFVGLSGEGGSSGACASCLSQLDLTASPPTIQPAPQPEVTTVVGAPLLQANAAGDRVFLSFATPTGGPVGTWNAASPNHFTTSASKESATDLAVGADGSMFATVAGGAAEIRGLDLTLQSTLASPELESIPGRVAVPGLTLHPTGALIYQPFLTGPTPPESPNSTPAPNLRGGVDILDSHSGRLRLRLFLPEPLAMRSTDIDALHGGFLAVDENGQRIFALTTSGLTVIQLANVPLGIGTVSPAVGAAAGGTALTLRGSGFQTGTTVTIGGKAASVTFKDINTLTVVTPSVNPGPQQIAITNPDGETVALDAAFTAR
jgi:hypothetical protein